MRVEVSGVWAGRWRGNSEGDGWRAQSSGGGSGLNDYWSGDDGCSVGGRFARALWSRASDTRRRLPEVQGCWLTGLTFASVKATQDAHAGNTQQSKRLRQTKRRHREMRHMKRQRWQQHWQQRSEQAVREPEAKEGVETAGTRGRERAG